MEAILLHSSADQSLSPYRHVRNPKRNHSTLISRPSETFAPPNFGAGVLLAPPPSLSFSHPPSISLFNSQQQQPPLLPLPLPIPKPSNNFRGRGTSCPPINRKISNRARAQSLTPKKSKPSVGPNKPTMMRTVSPECLILQANPSGPDPKDLERFSGSSVCTLSPPPSSLPLPTFFLRPKLSCKAEAAAGVDTGATDNLRRILRLP